jgi:hypothetical protein
VRLQYVALAFFASLLIVRVFNSLEWRLAGDPALFHYAALLMERQGLVPYRDFFETSMPGVFLFHYAIARFFGYGDLAFRLVDLTFLAMLLAATYSFVARFGRRAALWSVLIFGLVYLAGGQTLSLQRDYVGILPLVLALLCIPATGQRHVGLMRFVLVGLFCGLSALFKPHLALALPCVLASLIAYRRNVAGGGAELPCSMWLPP